MLNSNVTRQRNAITGRQQTATRSRYIDVYKLLSVVDLLVIHIDIDIRRDS